MSNPPSNLYAKGASEQTDGPPKPTHLESHANYKEPYSKRFKRYCNRNLGRVLIGIELSFAFALVVITGTYTYYAGIQKDVMIDQLKQAKAGLDLQRHLAGDFPLVDLTTWLGVSYDKDSKTLSYKVAVRMTEGKTGAENIRVASKIDIEDVAPIDYSIGTLTTVNPSSLPAYVANLLPWQDQKDQKGIEKASVTTPAIKEYRVITGQDVTRTAYVWGLIKFDDQYTHRPGPERPFCRKISVSKILDQAVNGVSAIENCYDTNNHNP